MKVGYLERNEDVSGVTGTGPVAEFAIASDGRLAIFWGVGVGVWPSLEEMLEVHGHGGKTIAVILNDKAENIAHCDTCHHHMANGGSCSDHDFGCPACLSQVA